jgi:hypothetical protein
MSGPNKDSVEGTVPHVERRLAAILSADVKGSSRLMGNNDVATVETLTAYREVLTQLVGEQRGRVVDAPGDELLAEFPASWMPSGLPGDRWQVYDLNVDGVSLVANYRAQFQQDYPDLLVRRVGDDTQGHARPNSWRPQRPVPEQSRCGDYVRLLPPSHANWALSRDGHALGAPDWP